MDAKSTRRRDETPMARAPRRGRTRDRSTLRLLTCGSVDDGKSTLIGRLLYECRAIFDDAFADISIRKRATGTAEVDYDFAMLLDGLQAEREQKITIDVAYRYFATRKRRFIIADTPGHEQYTRNMVTGASNCDLAVILVDARKGVLPQTRRHTCLVHLLGIKHVVLAVNKMDLVDFDRGVFEDTVSAYRKLTDALGIPEVGAIPVSALTGANLTSRSSRLRWYKGATLLDHLENAEVGSERNRQPFRLPVQWVCRPDQDFRGYAGSVASGRIAPGEEVVVVPSGLRSKVARIPTFDGDRPSAEAGDAVEIVLADDVSVGRGDVLCAPSSLPEAVDQFVADVVWFNEHPLLRGRPYEIRCATQTAAAQMTELRYKLNIENLDHVAGRELGLNEIGACSFATSKPIVAEPYTINRSLGSFIIIDRATNETVGAGMFRHSLRRASNIHWQPLNISKTQRAGIKGQQASCLWFTGLSGSGKSTLANLLEKHLHERGHHTYILDGDNVRHGLNRDLGFTEADRVENIRRVAEVARLMVDAGLIVIVAFISPYRAEREYARELFQTGEFLEVFVDTPIEICETRDPKGLYKKARAGLLPNFTGISSVYEAPHGPELRLAAGRDKPDQLIDAMLRELERRKII